MATAGHATMLYYARHGRVGLGIGMAYGALLKATSRACMAPAWLSDNLRMDTSQHKWCSQCFSSNATDMAYRLRFYIIKAVSVFISRTK